jgi:hypothetical protein
VIPSDPRTWTDFSNPESRGFDKVDCHTALERALMFGAQMLGIFAAIVLMTAFVETTGPWLSRQGIAIAVPALALGAGVLLGLRWLTNNFYLIDRARHAVYFHAQFAGFRRVRLLLERQDIRAMAVEARYRQSKRGNWWEHRAVLVDVRGRTVPLGNWEADALPAANTLARELATKLGCPSYEAPEDSRLVVRTDHARPEVTYVAVDLSWQSLPKLIAVLMFVLLGVLAAVYFLAGR